jgi:SOS-response transcriptional repressor LexA
MTENERFRCLVDYLKENRYIRNQQQFVEDVKSDKTTISQLLNGRISAPKILFGNVCTAYPFISMDWLRDGKGEMLKIPESDTRPRVDLYATGGGNEALDGVTLAQCEQIPVVPLFPRYDFTMRITGESMLPYLHPGDEVACLQINEPTFLQWGRIHVLSTSQGIVIKKIFDADGGIRCVSFNPDYPDFTIPKQEIYSYNLVVGLIRL